MLQVKRVLIVQFSFSTWVKERNFACFVFLSLTPDTPTIRKHEATQRRTYRWWNQSQLQSSRPADSEVTPVASVKWHRLCATARHVSLWLDISATQLDTAQQILLWNCRESILVFFQAAPVGSGIQVSDEKPCETDWFTTLVSGPIKTFIWLS